MVEGTYYDRASREVRSRYDLANQQMQSGRLEEAVDTLSGIISQEPGFAPAYNKLGVAEIARGDRAAAGHWFELALEADEHYAPALANLGNLALERKEYGTAQALYVQALDADGDCGSAHQNLAVVLQYQGRHYEAVRHLRMARRRMRRPTGYYFTARSRVEHQDRWYLIGIIAAVIFGFVYWISRW
jgi:tetratricopeptide (TPR) repeat protein